MTNSINEISDSKMMFVIGANPSEAHPVIAAKMRQARRKGAGLIVADPRKTELAIISDNLAFASLVDILLILSRPFFSRLFSPFAFVSHII